MRRAIIAAGLALFTVAGASVFLAENALHVWNRAAADAAGAGQIAQQGDASWKASRIAAEDGVPLEAWTFTPRKGNGAGVILLHGVGDTRMGMRAYAAFLLRAGYSVLMPDLRGHGASGGDVITYGIREAGDVQRWVGSLLRERAVERVYGLGQSMGAAILLESLSRESRFQAVVADCPFANFEEIAYDRLAQHGIRARAASWPLIELGFGYARLRYGVDLWQASPMNALRAATTPVLLIHGLNDQNIPPRHSRVLYRSNFAITQIWEVPHAGHTASFSTEPVLYQQRVLDWFASHRWKN